MTTYLRTEEYLPHAPKNAGTVHINHSRCPAGEDRKRRLYITRKQDGTVVAYCHHCAGTGSTKHQSRVGRGGRDLLSAVCTVEDDEDRKTPAYKQNTSVHFDGHASFRPETWPKEVTDWYQGFGITNEEAVKYGFHFIPSGYLAGRLGLPCFSGGTLNGIQFRRVLCKDGPKYLSRFASTTDGTTGVSSATGDKQETERRYFDSLQCKPTVTATGSTGVPVLRNGCVVVVEDVLSAIKVGRQCRAVACLTSTAPRSTLLSLAEQGYHTAYIWLDNDNTDVNRKARELDAFLGMVFPRVVFVTDKADPKHYTDAEISEVLNV